MYRLGIIDDDREFREHLRKLIESQASDFQIADFPDTESFLNAGSFDAAFVDIRLKDGSGIDGARRINAEQPGCRIVFCTGYPEFSPDVYSARHEYLVTKARLEEMLPLALLRIRATAPQPVPQRLAVARRGVVTLVPVEDIVYIERWSRTSTLFLKDGSTLSTSKKLDELHREIGSERFERCHVSYIVHLGKVEHVDPGSVLLVNGGRVPLSRAYARRFREAVARYIANHAAPAL